jgi:hypothetical protein
MACYFICFGGAINQLRWYAISLLTTSVSKNGKGVSAMGVESESETTILLQPAPLTRPSAQTQPRNPPLLPYPHLPLPCSHRPHSPELRSQPTWNPARRAATYPPPRHAESCASRGMTFLRTGAWKTARHGANREQERRDGARSRALVGPAAAGDGLDGRRLGTVGGGG